MYLSLEFTDKLDSILCLGGGEAPPMRPCAEIAEYRDEAGEVVTDHVVDFNEPLPFASESVDLFLSYFVLDRVRPKCARLHLEEAARILKEGGKVVLSFIDADVKAVLLRRMFFERNDKWDLDFNLFVYGDGERPWRTYNNAMSVRQVVEILGELGFHTARIDKDEKFGMEVYLQAFKGMPTLAAERIDVGNGERLFALSPGYDILSSHLSDLERNRYADDVVDAVVKPGWTAVDVGAHVGSVTTRLSRLVGPRGHVYAIEPEGVNFQLLQRNVDEHPLKNVTVRQVALGEREKTGLLRVGYRNSGDNRMWEHRCHRPTQSVQVTTFDNLFYGVDVDFVKLDVQGYEALVLKGAKSFLDAPGYRVLLTECWPNGLTAVGTSPKGMWELLKGFDVFWVHQEERRLVRMNSAEEVVNAATLTDPDGYADLLCVKGGGS